MNRTMPGIMYIYIGWFMPTGSMRLIRIGGRKQLLGALFFVLGVSRVLSQNPADFTDAARRAIDEGAQRLQAADGISLDTTVSSALYSEYTNFAVTYSADAGCKTVALAQDERTARAVDQFLNDAIIERQAAPLSLYARLAESCGSTAEASGWPGRPQNNFGEVLLPQGSMHLVRYDPVGKIIDFGRIAKGIAFLAGQYELGNIDLPNTGRLIVNIAPARASVLSQWAGPLSGQGLPARDRLDQAYLCTDLYLPATKPTFGSYPAVMAARGGRNPVPKQPATFSKAAAAVISVTGPQNSCSDACWRSVARLIAKSIGGWRLVCSDCQPDALIALDISGVRFVDARALDAFSTGVLQVPRPGVPPTGTNPLQQSAAFTVLSNTYVEVPVHDPAICSAVSAASQPTWKTALRGIVCTDVPPAVAIGAAQMLVQFVAEPLMCVPDGAASYLACGTVDQGVQLSLAELRYEWSDPHSAERFSMGRGTEVYDPQYVLLHEIGHWMGLTDAEIPGEVVGNRVPIMSNTYTGHACISATEATYLSAAADMTWSGRLENCSGLRRPNRRVSN
jgi:hypothetical protein